MCLSKSPIWVYFFYLLISLSPLSLNAGIDGLSPDLLGGIFGFLQPAERNLVRRTVRGAAAAPRSSARVRNPRGLVLLTPIAATMRELTVDYGRRGHDIRDTWRELEYLRHRQRAVAERRAINWPARGAERLGGQVQPFGALVFLELDLRNNPPTDAGMPHIAQIIRGTTALRTLQLNFEYPHANEDINPTGLNAHIGPAGAARLAEAIGERTALTDLSLNMRNNVIGDVGVQAISDALQLLTALRNLDLNMGFDRDGFWRTYRQYARPGQTLTMEPLAQAVENMLELRALRLNIDGVFMGNERGESRGVRGLQRVIRERPDLQSFELSDIDHHGPSTVDWLNTAAGNENIVRLALVFYRISFMEEFTDQLGRMRNLRDLRLTIISFDSNATDAYLGAVSHLRQLIHLELRLRIFSGIAFCVYPESIAADRANLISQWSENLEFLALQIGFPAEWEAVEVDSDSYAHLQSCLRSLINGLSQLGNLKEICIENSDSNFSLESSLARAIRNAPVFSEMTFNFIPREGHGEPRETDRYGILRGVTEAAEERGYDVDGDEDGYPIAGEGHPSAVRAPLSADMIARAPLQQPIYFLAMPAAGLGLMMLVLPTVLDTAEFAWEDPASFVALVVCVSLVLCCASCCQSHCPC